MYIIWVKHTKPFVNIQKGSFPQPKPCIFCVSGTVLSQTYLAKKKKYSFSFPNMSVSKKLSVFPTLCTRHIVTPWFHAVRMQMSKLAAILENSVLVIEQTSEPCRHSSHAGSLNHDDLVENNPCAQLDTQWLGVKSAAHGKQDFIREHRYEQWPTSGCD